MESNLTIGLPSHFTRLGAKQGVTGAIGELTAHLGSGLMDWNFYFGVCERYGLEREPWFAPQRLDLLLGFANECLQNRELLHPAQLQTLRRLRTFLRIEEGEFLQHRPSEIAQILREQLEVVLSDEVIDAGEDLYLASLQSLFGLGYDSFLSLTRVVFETAWAELEFRELEDDADSRSAIAVKKKLLEPMVRLATLQHRSVGALNS